MEENNDNLGDFLRERFNDFDENQGGWDKPDDEVRKQVLSQIQPPEKTLPIHSSYLRASLIALFFLAGSSYIFYLQKQNDALSKALQSKSEALEAIQRQLPSAERMTSPLDENILLDEKSKVKVLDSALKPSETTLINPLSSSDREIKNNNGNLLIISNTPDQLPSEISSMHLSPSSLLKVGQTPNANVAIDSIGKKRHFPENTYTNTSIWTIENIRSGAYTNSLSIPTLSTDLFPVEQLNAHEWQITKVLSRSLARNRAKFEIGYTFSLVNFHMQKEIKFERLMRRGGKAGGRNELLNSNGFSFAYSPLRNWWIETGFHYTTTNLKHSILFPTHYNRTGEFTRPDGSRVNELNLTSNNSFAEEKSTLEVTIPAGETIEDGEFLDLTITETQSLKYWQIPLSFAYHQYAASKLEWQIRGGMQWNRLELSDYNVAVSIESRRGTLPVRASSSSQEKKTNQFASAFVGLGINYELYHNWRLNAAVNFQRHLINNNTTAISNTAKRGTAFQLALNYRF